MKAKTPIWGLTGGIAAGKSTVAKIFEKMGVPVVDADQLARNLSSKGGAAYQLIQDRFGTTDRKKLREIVFADPDARKDLEEILHPLIQEQTLQAFEKIKRTHKPSFLIYEAALLTETGRYKEFAGLITVEAADALRIQRLMQRDKIPPELARKIIASQASNEDRRKVSQFIISNSGEISELEKQVAEVIQKIEKITRTNLH